MADLPAALVPLTKERRWCNWRFEPRRDETGEIIKNEKGEIQWTKPPLQPRDPTRKASNNDPSTWGTYEDAVRNSQEGTADGIGFMLMDGKFAAIDLDHCCQIEDEDLKIDLWASKLVDPVKLAYVEITPSGEGLRIIGRGRGEKLHRRFGEGSHPKGGIELYRGCERFITITGLQLGDSRQAPVHRQVDRQASRSPRSSHRE